jgi:hypothetical protein
MSLEEMATCPLRQLFRHRLDSDHFGKKLAEKIAAT